MAIDVPDATAYEPRATGQVLRMPPPGEPKLGANLSSKVGPQLVKADTRPGLSAPSLWYEEIDMTPSPVLGVLMPNKLL